MTTETEAPRRAPRGWGKGYDKTVGFRCAEGLREKIRVEAARQELSPSEWMRIVLEAVLADDDE